MNFNQKSCKHALLKNTSATTSKRFTSNLQKSNKSTSYINQSHGSIIESLLHCN